MQPHGAVVLVDREGVASLATGRHSPGKGRGRKLKERRVNCVSSSPPGGRNKNKFDRLKVLLRWLPRAVKETGSTRRQRFSFYFSFLQMYKGSQPLSVTKVSPTVFLRVINLPIYSYQKRILFTFVLSPRCL